MAGKKPAQILACLTGGEILPEQSLDRIRNFSRRAAISDRPRRRLMQTERSANAEVIGIDELPVDLDLLALNANVGNPVLPATVRASRDVQLQVLIEPGKRSSSSSTSQREKLFVSVMASLQNSVPLQATVPRQKAEPPTCNPIASSSLASSRH